MAILTTNTAEAWSPDEYTFAPADAVPGSLIMQASTVATTTLDGDQPVARVAFVDDGEAFTVDEGASIDQAAPTLAETLVGTVKVAQLLKVSAEQYSQSETATQLSASTQRALTRKANDIFLTRPAPSQGQAPLTGLLNADGIITGGTIDTDLDALADVIGQVENNGGQPSLIIANPVSWSDIRKVKTGVDSSVSLLGAGTADAERRLLGLPVVTDPAVPAGTMLVVDPGAIVSAVGQIKVQTSEHVYFSDDSIGLRATWRIGWALQHANRIATITVAGAGGDDESGE